MGDPPLCMEHSGLFEMLGDGAPESIGELAGRVLDMPVVQDMFDRFAGRVESFFQRDAKYHYLDQHIPPPQPRQARTQRPASAPAAPKRENPRVVLGFGSQVKLTTDMVKQRRRELATLWHPDRGGSTEALQKVNEAADALLKQLG